MTAQGPFTDRGSFLTAADAGSQTIKDPFFIVITASYYLCYSTEEGTLMVCEPASAAVRNDPRSVKGP